jgi:hypothetical protein
MTCYMLSINLVPLTIRQLTDVRTFGTIPAYALRRFVGQSGQTRTAKSTPLRHLAERLYPPGWLLPKIAHRAIY